MILYRLSAEYCIERQEGKISLQNVFRLLFIFSLITAVFFEGYYIITLRDKIDRQAEDLKKISLKLQASKYERDNLREELSFIKNTAGEDKDGNTPDR